MGSYIGGGNLFASQIWLDACGLNNWLHPVLEIALDLLFLKWLVSMLIQ
uniref:Uncharacterized protein n=1 Tax=Rhizophora mucronata TaxID=61149 RepID=A0A2P2QEI5_RHIMU